MNNYRKFRVLETLTAEADVSGSDGSPGNSKRGYSDDALVNVGNSSSSLSLSSSSWSTGLMRTRKAFRPTTAATTAAAAAATSAAVPAQPAGATAMSMPAAAAAVSAPSSASCLSSAAARAAITATGGGRREDRAVDAVAGTAPPPAAGKAVPGAVAAAPPALVSAKEMAAMKDPGAFHEALTLPFTGDASVEAYFQRIDGIMRKDVASVRFLQRWFVRDWGAGGLRELGWERERDSGING